jgi:hypothetical protein
MHNKRLAKNVLNLNRECIRNVCKLVQVKDNNLAKMYGCCEREVPKQGNLEEVTVTVVTNG